MTEGKPENAVQHVYRQDAEPGYESINRLALPTWRVAVVVRLRSGDARLGGGAPVEVLGIPSNHDVEIQLL